MRNIFLDTDVIIDYLTDRKPFAESSEQLFGLIETGVITGHASSLCFSNLFYLLKQQMSRAKAISSLKNISDIIHILPVDENTVLKAMESVFNDFEDAIHYYSAIENGDINVIVTRNVKDYKHSRLSVMTPDSLLQTLKK